MNGDDKFFAAAESFAVRSEKNLQNFSGKFFNERRDFRRVVRIISAVFSLNSVRVKRVGFIVCLEFNETVGVAAFGGSFDFD